MTTTAPPAAPPDEIPAPPRAPLALLRNTWRGLTSMRTALVLLFLLALAALPGALLPQRSLNQRLVTQYFADHPTLAPLLDKARFFDVFAAPWFAAVYLLLMVSLVGCLLPRAAEHVRTLRSPAVATPRNLARLPHAADGTLDAPVAEVEERVRTLLRGWRAEWRDEPGPAGSGPVRTVSAERGWLREVGNLVFHLSLLGLLVAFAAEALRVRGPGHRAVGRRPVLQHRHPRLRLVPPRPARRRHPAPAVLRAGRRLRGHYEPNGQPASFRAAVGYQTAADLAAGTDAWRSTTVSVNHPLRTDGSRVYLLGHGYAPRLTVTWPDGTQRTGETQWRPVDQTTLLSEGATKFARPGVTDEQQRRTTQLAVTGLLAPTSSGGRSSARCSPRSTTPSSRWTCCAATSGWTTGAASRSSRSTGAGSTRHAGPRWPGRTSARARRSPSTTAPASASTACATGCAAGQPRSCAGLGARVRRGHAGRAALSLTVRRRRFWVRLTPRSSGSSAPQAIDGQAEDFARRTVSQPGGGTRIELGGLARTDRAGYGEEFDRLRAELLTRDHGPDGRPEDGA